MLSFFFLILNQILIYAGPGAGEDCLLQTEHTLKQLAPSYEVRQILPDELLHTDWEKTTALFILPGGADLPYCALLNGPGNDKIRRYVESGGSFLGICAGSYYASKWVEFAPGSDLEVLGERELAFFPGTVSGPTLAPYDYETESGARAATLCWDGPRACVYTNGGGHFVEAASFPNVAILGAYETGEAAIVHCQVGKGVAILSGPHVEFDSKLLPSDPYLDLLLPDLEEGNAGRLALLRFLFQELNVCTQ